MIKFKVIEIANTFGVHRNTVTNWIKRGVLKAKPVVGRKYVISENDFIAFAEQNHIPRRTLEEFIKKNKIQKTEFKLTKEDQGFSNHPQEPSPKNKYRETIMNTSRPVGSVLVLGGGIAGIQAVLDLADSGYFVHLVERSSGIGGVMAQLDKTFPTNDCAM